MKNIELSKETRQDIITEIKKYFQDERDEDISDFQATLFLEFLLAHIAPPIYNQAITDAHKLMQERIEDLYGLEKRSR